MNIYFKKYQQNVLGMVAVTLPSASPANAAYSVERLASIWNFSDVKVLLKCWDHKYRARSEKIALRMILWYLPIQKNER